MSIVIPLLVGALAAWLAHTGRLDGYQSRGLRRISRFEFILGAFLIVVIAFVVTQLLGPNLARNSAINGYHEFYNGSVVNVRIVPDKCERDGSCSHTYTCDTEVIHHPAQYDSQGKLTQAAYTEVIDHQCPYATRELDYVMEDSLGRTIVVGNNFFEHNPRAWRSGKEIPDDVPRQPPERWLQAKQNLANGMADPVTGDFTYANYILASDSALYEEHDGSVERYQQAGLLPKHTAKLGGDMFYDHGTRADKVQVAGGLRVANLPMWQDRLMRLNAALGSELQGDLHVVLVPAHKVSNPDDYITALKAYWTSLGKRSISKNGIILAIGVSSDGKTVAWSRSDTGMPVGNGEMRTALNLRLTGQKMDPNILLGNVRASIRREGEDLKVRYDYATSGVVGEILLVDFPYKRPCMKCDDKEDQGVGYVDLKDLVPISTGAKILMFFIILILSCLLWGVLLAYDPLNTVISSRRSPNRY
jgi:hypothetical protein